MRELEFDVRGNLMPYKRVRLSFVELKALLVSSFDPSSTRHGIFENYCRFLDDFQTQVTPNFIQWVNGSFATKKTNPADIDFVTILDFKTFEEKEQLIEKQFRLIGARSTYGVDAYTVRKYPEGHRNHLLYQNELVYWDHWFTLTKKNRAKMKFPKGYIEVIFGDINL